MRRPGKGDRCTRERWRADVLKAKKLPSSTRMFLAAVLAPHMKADGFVSVPRVDLADEMGVDERTITRHFTRARESGWLASLRVGHKGMTAEYMASWPNTQSGTTVVPLRRPQRGTETTPLTRDKNVPLWLGGMASKRDTWCPATSSYYVTTGPDQQHDTRTCVCEECSEWRWVILGRVRAAGVGPASVFGLGNFDSNSKTQPRINGRASA